MMSENQDYPMRSYEQWSSEPHRHWIDAGNTFGVHLMQQVRDRAVEQSASEMTIGLDQAKQVADLTLWTLMDFLDGYFRPMIDERHRAEYVLLMRVCDTEHQVVETIELAPAGDGLAMGFAGWQKGDFGQAKNDPPGYVDVVTEV